MSFLVRVADNFHYMDEEESYDGPTFSTWEEAVAKAKEIVEWSLQEGYKPGMSAEALYGYYKSFGDDPYIIPTAEGEVRFSAWDYAKQRAEEMCKRPEDETPMQ